MKRTAQVILAGAGAAAGIYGLIRLLGGKRIKTLPYGYGIKIKNAVTINAPAGRLYVFWRKVENLPSLFENIVSEQGQDDCRANCRLRPSGGQTPEGDGDINAES